MRSRTIAAAIIGLAALGGTSEAQASTLAVNAPCYLESEPISATGTGFTAGAPVNFSFDGQLAANGTADGAGNITQQLIAPSSVATHCSTPSASPRRTRPTRRCRRPRR